MSMNARVARVVREQADAFYEGRVSSLDAYRIIDQVCGSAFNWYPGILNDTRQAFDLRVSQNIDRDVDEHRNETYASRQLRNVREDGTPREEEYFLLKVAGDSSTKWLNITPAQLDAIITALELNA